MIRVLIMIAVAGFVLALASLSAAVAIGGPDAIARGGWHWAADWRDRDDFDWDPEFDLDETAPAGPQATRTIAWTGRDTLRVRFPADVRFVQARGDERGTVTVTGPKGAVDRLSLDDDGALRLRRHHWANQRMTVVVTAPNITRFVLGGANRLTVEDYRGERLELKLSGATKVTASGDVRELELDMSGAGEVDLSQLKVVDADIDISGAGEARVAPTGRARIDISGMGDVTLLTRPAQLDSDISGAGAIHQPESPAPATAEGKTRT